MEFKDELIPNDYCQTWQTIPFLPYMQYVTNLDPSDEPNYEKMRFMLVSELLLLDMFPRNLVFCKEIVV